MVVKNVDDKIIQAMLTAQKPYQILEEIGEGGMGSVYRASRADDQYRKEVAIKVVRAGLDTRVARARASSLSGKSWPTSIIPTSRA